MKVTESPLLMLVIGETIQKGFIYISMEIWQHMPHPGQYLWMLLEPDKVQIS